MESCYSIEKNTKQQIIKKMTVYKKKISKKPKTHHD